MTLKSNCFLFALFFLFQLLYSQKNQCLSYKDFDVTRGQVERSEAPFPIQDSDSVQSLLKENKIRLLVINDTYAPFSDKGYYASKDIKEGFQLFIINTTNKSIQVHRYTRNFSVFRIVFYQGEWRNVVSHKSQHREAIGCGNYYSSNYFEMQQGTYLPLVTPCIDGNAFLKTRFAAFIKTNRHEKLTTIFSTEFESSIDTSLIEIPKSKSKKFQSINTLLRTTSHQ